MTNKDIIETAKSYIGKLKYVFGGNNIDGGFGDCSDFTEHVFNVHGLNIGYDTESQYLNSSHVSEFDVQAGDLIFFKNTYSSGKTDGVSHVGIMINNSQFVHLSSSGCAVNNVTDSYWKEHFLDFRRVAGVNHEEVSDYYDMSTDTAIPSAFVSDEEKAEILAKVTRTVTIISVILIGIIFFISIFKDEIVKGVLKHGA